VGGSSAPAGPAYRANALSPGGLHLATPIQENIMSDDLPILTAEFPKSVRGYSVEAVDEFVQEIGERLNALQAELAKQAARGDRLADEVGGMEAELHSFRDKEKAVSSAFIAAESFKAKAESDYEAALEKARGQAEEIMAAAKSEAE